MVEDEKLVSLARRGEQQAFQQLVEKYQHFVFTIAHRLLRSREEAEEAAQDTFVKVYRMLGSFEGKSKFSTWLYTIAYRTAVDVARRKQIRVNSLDDEESHLQIRDEATLTPVEHTQKRDLQDHLQVAIARLKPLDSALITLFYLQEHTVPEVADITGLTVTNVKTKLHRLREKLRLELSQELRTEARDLL